MNENNNAPKCRVASKCSGCQLSNMTYQQQLDFKQRKVARLLDRFGKVERIIGMDNPYHYRGKVQSAFRYDIKRHQVVSGVFQSSTHAVVPIDKCLLEDKIADAIVVTIRNLMKSFKMTVYNEHNRTGFLRHVLVRRGFSTGEVMVVIVSANSIIPSKNNFVKALLKVYPEITTIVLNVNKSDTNLILGDFEKTLYGKGYIEDVLCGCRFRISPKSFYQVNPVQTEVLYNKALEMAELDGSETLIDAYCGVGTIGITASSRVKNVIGVEQNRDAVRDAISNVKLNKLENVRIFCADASDFLEELADSRESVDVVVMDPPRAGSDERFLASVAKLAPKKIVYISCNPETQVRDLKSLIASGYKATKIQPVDMFPHTNHVECVVLMSRVQK